VVHAEINGDNSLWEKLKKSIDPSYKKVVSKPQTSQQKYKIEKVKKTVSENQEK